MSDTASNDGKSKMISLKGKSSTVRQSFSHGRSKSVVVETKRKRLFVPKNSDTNALKPSVTKERSEENQITAVFYISQLCNEYSIAEMSEDQFFSQRRDQGQVYGSDLTARIFLFVFLVLVDRAPLRG